MDLDAFNLFMDLIYTSENKQHLTAELFHGGWRNIIIGLLYNNKHVSFKKKTNYEIDCALAVLAFTSSYVLFRLPNQVIVWYP